MFIEEITRRLNFDDFPNFGKIYPLNVKRNEHYRQGNFTEVLGRKKRNGKLFENLDSNNRAK